MLKQIIGWFIAGSLAVVVAPSRAADLRTLLPADETQSWNTNAKSGELIFTGDAVKSAPCLKLSKKALADSSIVFQIDSDCQGFTLISGESRIDTLRPARSVSLTCDAEAATLKIDGRESPNLRGRWMALCAQADPGVTFVFNTASYVNIKVIGGAAPAAATPVSLATPRAGIIDSASAIKLASQSVFQVKVFNEKHEAFASGTGFVVRPDGVALTNFHVINGASSATAVFPGGTQELSVELLAAKPELDLALLKVSDCTAPALPLDTREPGVGTEVWALGFPLGLGLTVNRGIVSAVHQFSDLPKTFKEGLKDYAADSHWLQTDCTINHGNSGGPLIAADGSVQGINTLVWANFHDESVNNVFFALKISDAAPLAASNPPEPLTFAKALTQFADKRTPMSSLPMKLPRLELPQNARPTELNGVATAVAGNILKPCSVCNGRGTITVKQIVGSHLDGGMRYNDTRASEQSCPRCSGAKFSRISDDALGKLTSRFLLTLAGVKPDDGTFTAPLQKSYDAIEKTFVNDQGVKQTLTEQSKAVFAQTKLSLKTPVVFNAEYGISLPLPEKTERAVLALVRDSDQIVAVLNPIINEDVKGGNVMIGGLVAGSTATRDGRKIVVVQNGFIVKDNVPYVKMYRTAR